MTDQEEIQLQFIETGYKAGIYYFQIHWKELIEGPLDPPDLVQQIIDFLDPERDTILKAHDQIVYLTNQYRIKEKKGHNPDILADFLVKQARQAIE